MSRKQNFWLGVAVFIVFFALFVNRCTRQDAVEKAQKLAEWEKTGCWAYPYSAPGTVRPAPFGSKPFFGTDNSGTVITPVQTCEVKK